VLTDKLTNRSVRGLETCENELTNRSVHRGSELTNIAVQFKANANAVENELTHRLVHML
jgi:hypothetical protein